MDISVVVHAEGGPETGYKTQGSGLDLPNDIRGGEAKARGIDRINASSVATQERSAFEDGAATVRSESCASSGTEKGYTAYFQKDICDSFERERREPRSHTRLVGTRLDSDDLEIRADRP